MLKMPKVINIYIASDNIHFSPQEPVIPILEALDTFPTYTPFFKPFNNSLEVLGWTTNRVSVTLPSLNDVSWTVSQ